MLQLGGSNSSCTGSISGEWRVTSLGGYGGAVAPARALKDSPFGCQKSAKTGPPFRDRFWSRLPAEQIITHGRVSICSAGSRLRKRTANRGHEVAFFPPPPGGPPRALKTAPGIEASGQSRMVAPPAASKRHRSRDVLGARQGLGRGQHAGTSGGTFGAQNLSSPDGAQWGVMEETVRNSLGQWSGRLPRCFLPARVKKHRAGETANRDRAPGLHRCDRTSRNKRGACSPGGLGSHDRPRATSQPLPRLYSADRLHGTATSTYVHINMRRTTLCLQEILQHA